jgi:hypothetical protein
MPRKPKRNDEVVKVDSEVVRMARIVAAIEGITLAEVLSESLRPVIAKRLTDHQQKGFGPRPEKPKK